MAVLFRVAMRISVMKTGIKRMEDGIMKQSLILAAAIISLTACTRTQEEVDVNTSDTLTLVARTEMPKDTRTVVDSDTFVFWESGDEIAVFSGNRSARFVTDIDIESPMASFSGELPGWVEGQELWAVYPYSEEASFDGQTITTVLPAVQVARAGSFGQGMNLSVAKAFENTLYFYNVGGGVRFSVLEEGVKRVVFEGRNGEELAGTVKIGFDENEFPKVQEVVSGLTSVTLLPPEGQEYFDTDVWYYMVAIPGPLEKGYKMTLVKDDGYGERSNYHSLSIKRGIYGSIKYADNGVEFDNPITHFPETESEWEQSIALTESLSEEVQPLIQGYKESLIDLDVVLREIRDMAGVLEASVNKDQSVIMVMQRDSVCINYLIRDVRSSRLDSNRGQLVSNRPRYQTRDAAALEKSGSFVSPGKKALILAPFHSVFCEPFEDIKPELEECFSNVDVFVNEKAELSCFKENFLGQYDFILISTHGVLDAKSLKRRLGYYSSTYGLVSSTPYTYSSIVFCLKNGINPMDLMTVEIEGERYLAMTSDFLKKKQLNNCAVILSACYSATDKQHGSIIDSFLSNGARVISGTLTKVAADSDNIVNEMMVAYMNHGLSFQRAFNYVLFSDKTQTAINALKEIYETKDWESLDIPNNYWRNNSDPFFIKDPFPYNLSHSTANDVISFSWDSNIEPFTVSWKDHLDGSDWKNVDYSYDVRYDLYVHDACVLSDLVDRQATWTLAPSIISDSWYVVAKIMEGDLVLESFKSDVVEIKAEPEAVDLGLSVKWATMNLGAGRPEDPGDYFAWGETEPKSSFYWSNYKWYVGDFFTKYSIDPNNGFVDYLITLEPEDDAAHVKWGGKWRMPTAEECRELISNCTWSYSALNGRNGYFVTNKDTGMSIFLPAGGYYSTDMGNTTNNISGSIWSSSLPPGMAGLSGGNIGSHYLTFGPSKVILTTGSRAAGLTIRAVCDY